MSLVSHGGEMGGSAGGDDRDRKGKGKIADREVSNIDLDFRKKEITTDDESTDTYGGDDKGKTEAEGSKEAASPIYLSQDIVECIMLRLPVKTLFCLRPLAKYCNTLVYDHKFITQHFQVLSKAAQRFPRQSHSMTLNRGCARNGQRFYLDACLGMMVLFCVARPRFPEEIFIWNPATRMFKYLPNSTNKFGKAESVSLGFGCDIKQLDFKVVRLFWLKTKQVRAEVYSSKQDCWKIVEVGVEGWLREDMETHYLIAKGNPHWLANIDDKYYLVKFDSSKDEFQIVENPPPEAAKVGTLSFVEWEGELAAVLCSTGDEYWLNFIQIWTYSDEKKKWEYEKMITLNDGEALQVMLLLGCSSHRGILLGGRPDGRVFLLDYKRGSSRLTDFMTTEEMFAYEQSLSYVGGMTPAELEVSHDNNGDGGGGIPCIDGFVKYWVSEQGAQSTCKYTLAM